uniref:Uncharacterized protein n=1 Tax=Hucho hucho TaxID=62062 RepID=A0A4W5JIR3_9TELE
MAAHFIRDQWTCLGYGRRIGPPGPLELPRASGSLQAAIEALSLLPSGLVLPVLDFMASMLPQVALSEEALCVEAVTVSWKLVLGLSSNPHDVWPTLQGFVTMAFHHSLLELTEEQAPGLTVTLQQVTRGRHGGSTPGFTVTLQQVTRGRHGGSTPGFTVTLQQVTRGRHGGSTPGFTVTLQQVTRGRHGGSTPGFTVTLQQVTRGRHGGSTPG